MAPKQWSNFHVGRECSHQKWSRRNTPKFTVSSGDTVSFDAIDSSNGQLDTSSKASAIKTLDLGLANPVFGPIYMNDAHPGDVLKVEVLDLEVADWGWSAIIPGFGLLADEFPEPEIKIWELNREAGFAQFKNMRIPLRPFLGCMGLAPANDEELSTVPPTNAGGNLDCRELSVGSTVFLPVQTAGALFSCGDGHAAQGHGEVCGTAIETPIRATLRFELLKKQPWMTAPQFQTPPSPKYQTLFPTLEPTVLSVLLLTCTRLPGVLLGILYSGWCRLRVSLAARHTFLLVSLVTCILLKWSTSPTLKWP
ncbi:unnamed protein product [Penicillium nalgiovense]|nr:unnamed protein product [Penicillium nalgiovense]